LEFHAKKALMAELLVLQWCVIPANRNRLLSATIHAKPDMMAMDQSAGQSAQLA